MRFREELSRIQYVLSFYNKQDPAEVDRIYDMMIKKGLMTVDANGHVTWPME